MKALYQQQAIGLDQVIETQSRTWELPALVQIHALLLTGWDLGLLFHGCGMSLPAGSSRTCKADRVGWSEGVT